MPIDLLALSAALLTGLLGGIHCVAMCGGIAVGAAAGATPAGGGPRLRPALELNLGRVGGYALAGAAAGGLGSLIVSVARTEAVAIGLRALVGAVLVVAALRMLGAGARLGFMERAGQALWQRLRPLTKPLLPAHSTPRRLALGALWGWLPCGLSTTVLFAAWFTADALHGALLMAVFGSGTLAAMVPVTWSGARLAPWLARPANRRAAGLVVLAAGLLTLGAPLLAQVPAMHGLLEALGCRSLPGT